MLVNTKIRLYGDTIVGSLSFFSIPMLSRLIGSQTTTFSWRVEGATIKRSKSREYELRERNPVATDS